MMENFNYYNPVKIVFGKKKEKEIGSVLKEENVGSVLLIYGKGSVKRSGVYDRVIKCLKEADIKITEYGGIKSNPLVRDADLAARLAIEKGCEAVLALGGGSVMDSAKAIAAAADMNCSAWDFFTGTEITGALPVYNIVTLAATASEMNCGFVLTNEETGEKLGMGNPLLYPRISILNPQLTETVPPDYTAYSAVDILAHVLEGYLTRDTGPDLMNRFAESIIKTVMETTEVILKEPHNYDARGEFMWAATMALNGTLGKGTGGASSPNHMIEHGVSAVLDIAHGAGLAILMPAWMEWYYKKNLPQFERLSREIFGLESGEEGIKALKSWFQKIGAPVSFKDIGVGEERLEELADKALKQGECWGMDKMYPRESILEILRLAL